MKKYLSLLLVFIFVFLQMPIIPQAADLTEITVLVEYGQTEARTQLDMINDLRRNDAWYYNEENVRTERDGLADLSYDYALEEYAMQRAAEIAVMYSHTRLDGESRGVYSGIGSYDAHGENIAYGYNTANEVFAAWTEAEDSYAGQGHRRNMLGDFECVAVGHAIVGGTHYWTQEFGSPDSGAESTSAVDAMREVTLSVQLDFAPLASLRTNEASVSLAVGESAALPAVYAEWNGNGFECVRFQTATADAGIAKVENQSIAGLSPGNTVLTVSLAGKSVSVDITVTDETAEQFPESLKTDEKIDDSSFGALPDVFNAEIVCSASKDSNFRVTLYDNGVLVISGRGAFPLLDSPLLDVLRNRQDQVRSVIVEEGLTVMSPKTFELCRNLTSVVLPESLTSLPDSAFMGCESLESIVIPNGVERIDQDVFAGCSNLKSVTIPNSVTEIDLFAFYGCRGLQSITIPEGVTFVDSRAFDHCSSLTNITVSEKNSMLCSVDGVLFTKDMTRLISYPADKPDTAYKIPNGVTEIENGAFFVCKNLTSVAIPESVTDIDHSAFFGCSRLKDVEIEGNGITHIGVDAFTETYYSNHHKWNQGILYIGNCLIEAKLDLYSAEIAEGTVCIADGAFGSGNGLKSVMFPESIRAIGVGAFQNCTKLTNIVLPVGVTIIWDQAFENCRGLTKIEIPDSVESIGSMAFSGCEKLAQISLSEGICRIGLSAFSQTMYYNDPANWHDGVLYIGNYLIDAQTSLAGKYSVREGTTVIADCAFSKCEMTAASIPATVAYIGYQAFYYCDSLESVTIKYGVKSIGDYAFLSCKKLKDIILPGSITSIGAGAFQECTRLKDIAIPADLTSISNYTFCNCSLESVIIPDGVTTIGAYAFAENDLLSVSIPDSVKHIGSHAFKHSGLISVSIPDSVECIGAGAFQYCGNLQSVELPSGVTKIENSTFDGCYGLREIVLPDSVTSIGSFAFENCSVLSDVSFPSSCENIGCRAFANCAEFAEITLPDSVRSIGCDAFNNTACYINKINWDDGVLYIGKNLIRAMLDAAAEYTVREGTACIADGAFACCYNMKKVMLPISVSNIGLYAFLGCRSLSDAEIPARVTGVNEWTFSYCKGLKSLTIPSDVKRVSYAAFIYCSGLSDIFYGGSEDEWFAIKIEGNNECLTNSTVHPKNSAAVFISVTASPTTTEPASSPVETELHSEINTSAQPDTPVPTGLIGDISGDGKINSADARLALRYAAKLQTFTDAQMTAADVNRDGKVNSQDARRILRHAAKMELIVQP